MKIRYLGHSSFLLASEAGTAVVTDPFGGIGFPMPSVKADAVTVSHSHYDHCNVSAVSGAPVVFSEAGKYVYRDVEFFGLPCWHDGENGRLRGKNLIFKMNFDGLSVCHLGDLGERCSPALVGAIGRVDILFIPVGGVYTIDAPSAKEYVEAIRPAIAVPMHFMTKGLNMRLGSAEEFADLFSPNAVGRCGCELAVSRRDVGNKTKIIIMERQ